MTRKTENIGLNRNLRWYHYLLAVSGIIYGLTKIVIGCISFILPESKKERLIEHHKWLKVFITIDETIAGKAIEIALIIFGVYSLLNSLDVLKIIDLPFINTREFLYGFYTIMGLILTFFYMLVVYTTLPIPKRSDQMIRYKAIGLVGGLLFLIMTPLYIVFNKVIDHGHLGAFSREHLFVSLAAIGSAVFIAATIVALLLDAYKTKKHDQDLKARDLISIAFIPIGWT